MAKKAVKKTKGKGGAKKVVKKARIAAKKTRKAVAKTVKTTKKKIDKKPIKKKAGLESKAVKRRAKVRRKRAVGKVKVKKTVKAKKIKEVEVKRLVRVTKSIPRASSKKIAKNKANIKVVGVGGGGGNAISRMKDNFIRGIEFIAINTDVQDLEYCNAHKKISIGKTLTRGLGTGMNPDVGLQAAEENRAEIADALSGADLVFITAGLGGGTGSGASITIAEVAKEVGALTVAIVTKPFTFEGGQRAKIAEESLNKIKERVDTYISVPNDKIFEVVGRDTSINKAFEAIDKVLRGAVQGVAELIAMPGIVNVDFADVKTIMQNSGSALVGIGVGTGKDRGVNAVNQLLNFPLLEVAIDGARGVLFGISGGRDMKMAEINEVANAIVENVNSSAKIIFGAYYDRKLKQGSIKVTLIATGFDSNGVVNSAESQSSSGLLAGTTSFDSAQSRLTGTSTISKEVTTDDPSNFGSANAQLPFDKESDKKDDKQVIREEKGAVIRVKKSVTDETVAKNKDNSISGDFSLKKSKEEKKKSTEIWDIPAFLRRKKKEK